MTHHALPHSVDRQYRLSALTAPLALGAALLALALLAGCTPRGSEATAEPIATPLSELLEQDLRQLDEDAAAAARQGLKQFRGEDFAPGQQPVRLWSLGQHYILASMLKRDDTVLHVEFLAEGEGLRWQRALHLGSGWTLGEVNLGSHAEVEQPLLVVDTQPADGSTAGRASRLYLAIGSRGGLLVRAADSERQLANHQLSSDHPHLHIDEGNIGSNDRSSRLAALVALAQTDAAAERGSARVQGHLDNLAGGTNLWLAEAAALVLTLPRN